MNRFLPTLLLLLTTAPSSAADRPNFLFLLTDDQRYDALGVVQREQGEDARFPWCETPYIDRLAARSTRFRNAFVVCSLCSPGRAALLTGQYNHVTGVVNNHTPLSRGLDTYADLLRRAGYATGYTGKWHMGRQETRPGFDFSASFVGQGRYMDCPVLVNGKQTETAGWVDDVSTDYAIDFLKRQTDDQPFCLVVGFKSLHGPRRPASVPDRLADLYTDIKIKPPENEKARPPFLGKAGTSQPRRPSKATVGRSIYFQLLRGVDQNVGRLMAALDKTGLAENTVIVYMSDNGYFLGEHGVGDKRLAYEESIRIPLLIHVPGAKGGGTVDAMTLNIDLAPTLLDLAGVEVPETMPGRSLRPLLEGRTPDDWRTAFFYEYFKEPPYKAPTNFALRTGDAKLILYPGHDDWTELFDLRTDPHEMHNLAEDPKHAERLRGMQAELERRAKTLGLPVPLPAEAAVD